jgi:hypothetical protein
MRHETTDDFPEFSDGAGGWPDYLGMDQYSIRADWIVFLTVNS